MSEQFDVYGYSKKVEEKVQELQDLFHVVQVELERLKAIQEPTEEDFNTLGLLRKVTHVGITILPIVPDDDGHDLTNLAAINGNRVGIGKALKEMKIQLDRRF